MTLNLPLLYFVWTEEYCQTSPNKNKSPNIWHVTSILVCCIFGCAPWQFASENFWKQESFFRTLWNIDELKVGGTWIWPNFCYNSDLWTSTILLYRAVGDSRLGRAIPQILANIDVKPSPSIGLELLTPHIFQPSYVPVMDLLNVSYSK